MAKSNIERDPAGVPTDENFYRTLYAPAVGSSTKTAEIFNPAVDSDAVTVDVTTPPSLATLTAEIKFYFGQIRQNIIEVGKRLMQAKEIVPHGDWQNWLKDNFNLSYRTAAKFMQCAERFSNVPTSAVLNPSQMIELLSLPEGDTEKFIADKVTEGKNIEAMTIKELRQEIKCRKAHYAENYALPFEKNNRLRQATSPKTDTVEIVPADYEETKDLLKAKGQEVESLKAQLKSMHNPDINARKDCLELLNKFYLEWLKVNQALKDNHAPENVLCDFETIGTRINSAGKSFAISLEDDN